MVKIKHIIFLAVFTTSFAIQVASGQALIALLFGKKITSTRLHVGIIVGASGSYLENASGEQPRYGFAIGAYTTYDLNTNWQLAMDIIMKSPKGANAIYYENSFKAPDAPELVGEEFTRKIVYMSFSPMIRYRFTPSFGIAVGPYGAIRTVAKDIYEKGTDNGKLSYTYNAKDDIHRIDGGATFDIQYTLMKGKGIRLNAQYNLGLGNIYKGDMRGKNRQFLVAVGIPIGAR
ncbi:Outer membrane protein beta-barrel domain-containing protein [Chitinophaga jiangningensis]|uniref:Outer membrane protein beta-barrel domain-containing protein n=1 Tax=Chitinophaga jiangningensis TaxID=1419482 RepID=A0A1M7LVH9_9BACT|nr:outer membrane beta-barrel protein [Chitinophaga jiangningensis]SHM82346.1 Outer membrane protein beta-barrel domain-containing protein [Chitinophaga jiangningensis]